MKKPSYTLKKGKFYMILVRLSENSYVPNFTNEPGQFEIELSGKRETDQYVVGGISNVDVRAYPVIERLIEKFLSDSKVRRWSKGKKDGKLLKYIYKELQRDDGEGRLEILRRFFRC